MTPDIITGDLLEQPVEVIVNSWNRNILPWWLLLPQGVSGAIKKRGGTAPFQELGRCGAIPLGEARLTTAGRLPYQAIIHVAGINLLWFATEASVRQSVVSAMNIVRDRQFQSVAFPLIGSGSGNRGNAWSLQVMLDALAAIETRARVVIVKYRHTWQGRQPWRCPKPGAFSCERGAPMMTLETARQAVGGESGPVGRQLVEDELVILDHQTSEKGRGRVFFYQSRKYIEHDIREYEKQIKHHT